MYAPAPDMRGPRALAGAGVVSLKTGCEAVQQPTPRRGQWPWSVSDPDHFLLRLLQDMAEQINADQWDRRAEWFDTCNPFLALQCRRHAWLLRNVHADTEIPAALRG